MNTKTLLELAKLAKDYSEVSCESVKINSHMNEIKPEEKLDQRHVNAILVDFINYIGMKGCIDFGMYTEDLES